MKIKKLRQSELKAAVYGMLLGDACLHLAGERAINYRLSLAHSTKQQEYALWKKTILDQIGAVTTKVYEYTHPIKGYSSIRVTTNARRYFSKIAPKYYPNKGSKKILPESLLNKLGVLGLAIWYMDDGSIQRRGTARRCYLHTQNFSLEENHRIQKWFETKYSISPKVQLEKKKNGKEYYLLVFNSEECDKFLNVVRPHIIESMKYKL